MNYRKILIDKNMDIPPEIMTEILYRLPAKSLGRFKAVSKNWLAQISEPKFINDHLNTYKRIHFICNSYVCSTSIYTLPFNELDHETPEFRLLMTHVPHRGSFIVHGSCNGLVLVSPHFCQVDDFHVPYPLVILNPTTEEHIILPIAGHEMLDKYMLCTCGFGYDSLTDDYKVLTLTFFHTSYCVHVYSLRNNTWRRVMDFPYADSEEISSWAVFVNGFLHWIANKRSDGLPVIAAFSLADETFSEVPLPDLVNCPCKLVAFGEKLGMLVKSGVWVMKEYGVRESWSKIVIHALKLHDYSIAETKIFYEDGIIMLGRLNLVWVCDVEGKFIRKTVDTSKDIKGLWVQGTYVESLVSLKSSLANQKSASSSEGSHVENHL